MYLNTLNCVHMQAQGRLASIGRTLTFDASANGFCRGETATSLILKSMTNLVDGEVVLNEDTRAWIGTIASAACNQSGKRASMTSVDAVAQQECIAEAIRLADISPLDCDACECAANGRILEDAIEAAVTGKAYRPDGMAGLDETPGFAYESLITSMQNQIEAMGQSQVLRVLVGASWGALHPNLHLRVMNPHMDLDVCDRHVVLPQEAFEFRLSSTYTGVMNSSYTGANSHFVCFGQVTDEKCLMLPAPTWKREAIIFWPEGGGSLDADSMPKRGYSIVGSFNKWAPEPMDSEGPGVYAYTMTLGENKFERFQINLDGDARRALHPGVPRSDKGLPLFGPAEVLRRDAWFIDGRTSLEVPTEDGGIETVTIESPDAAEPGDQYRVRLRISGKWRTVDWEKLDEEGKMAVPACTYQISGTWNDGKVTAMSKDPDTPGLHTVEVTLPSNHGSMFHIIRDEDWDQAIYPAWDGADESAEVLGPEEPVGHAWALQGKAGDVFRIEFQRFTDADGKEVKKVNWKFLRNEPPSTAMKEQASRPQFFVSGSWDTGTQFHRMNFTGEYYQFYVVLGKGKKESFRVFDSGDWNRCFHPSVANANPHVQHELRGPATGSDGVTWTIGHHDGDLAEPGKKYEVRLFVDESMQPLKVDWMVVRGVDGLEDARGRGFLAFGT
jgi:hypothetical protein